MNPEARILRAVYGEVPLQELIETHRYDYERGFEHPDWDEEWNKLKLLRDWLRDSDGRCSLQHAAPPKEQSVSPQ